MDDIFPDLDIDNLDEEDKDDVLSLSEIEGFIATANKLVQHMDFFESAKCRKLKSFTSFGGQFTQEVVRWYNSV